jgi:hypothetical protein
LAPGQVVWLSNPPYTSVKVLGAFLARAVATARDGVTVVGLLPASTGAEWLWRFVIEAGEAGGGSVGWLLMPATLSGDTNPAPGMPLEGVTPAA